MAFSNHLSQSRHVNLLAIKKLKNYLQNCTALDILALNCHPNNSAGEELLYAKEIMADMITCELSKTRHQKKLFLVKVRRRTNR